VAYLFDFGAGRLAEGMAPSKRVLCVYWCGAGIDSFALDFAQEHM
jgi:hypothetical protein